MGISLWKSLAFFLGVAVLSVAIFPSQRELGMLYSKSRFWDKAALHLARIFHENPHDAANARRYMGSLNRQGDYIAAEVLGKNLVKLFPENREVLGEVCFFYESHRRPDEAAGLWKKILILDPKNDEVREKIAGYCWDCKDFEGLIEIYEQKAGDRGELDDCVELARLYGLTRQPERVREVYLRILRDYPEETYFEKRLASLEESLGHTAEALERYRSLSEEDPENLVLASEYTARFLKYQKEGPGAEALLKDMIGRFPREGEFRSLLAERYLAAGRNGEALKIYEDMIGEFPNEAPAYYGLGALYAGLKRWSEAKNMLEVYHEKTNGDNHSHHLLGDVLLELGNLEGANAEYEHALEHLRRRR